MEKCHKSTRVIKIFSTYYMGKEYYKFILLVTNEVLLK